MQKVQSSFNFKTCALDILKPYIVTTKELTSEVLEIEGEVTFKEIQVYQAKLQKTFGRIEQKIVDLNDAKYKLSEEELMDLEDLCQMLLVIKKRFHHIMEGI